jgi:hypothetical protein
MFPGMRTRLSFDDKGLGQDPDRFHPIHPGMSVLPQRVEINKNRVRDVRQSVAETR